MYMSVLCDIFADIPKHLKVRNMVDKTAGPIQGV